MEEKRKSYSKRAIFAFVGSSKSGPSDELVSFFLSGTIDNFVIIKFTTCDDLKNKLMSEENKNSHICITNLSSEESISFVKSIKKEVEEFRPEIVKELVTVYLDTIGGDVKNAENTSQLEEDARLEDYCDTKIVSNNVSNSSLLRSLICLFDIVVIVNTDKNKKGVPEIISDYCLDGIYGNGELDDNKNRTIMLFSLVIKKIHDDGLEGPIILEVLENVEEEEEEVER